MTRSSHAISQPLAAAHVVFDGKVDSVYASEAAKLQYPRSVILDDVVAVIADHSWQRRWAFCSDNCMRMAGRMRNSIVNAFGVAPAGLISTVSAPHALMCTEHMDISPLANDLHHAYIISKSARSHAPRRLAG